MQIKTGKWLLLIIIVLALVFVALPALAIQKDSEKDKVAVVNGTIITQDYFDREMDSIKQRISSSGKPVADSQLSLIKKRVLESIIGAELIYQKSQSKGIKIDESEINKQWEAMKERFPTENELNNALKEMKLSEKEVKSQIKKGLAIQKFIDTQIVQKVMVSDKEVKAYYDSRPNDFKQPAQVKASHILIKIETNADESKKKEARKKIEKIQKKIKKGEAFAALAKESSQCPSSAKGGELGYFSRGQMVKPFEEAAFALKVGDVSDIVESKFGYHLIKVNDQKDETTIDFEKVKSELQKAIKQDKIKREINSYVAKLRGKAKVEILLK